MEVRDFVYVGRYCSDQIPLRDLLMIDVVQQFHIGAAYLIYYLEPFR